ILTPRSYAEAIEGPYSSQWEAAMDAEMASWKSTGTYVDEVPPPEANIVSGMWIFRVKRPPGSPSVFKARYVAHGFTQREGVDFFQTFSPTPKMTTFQVLLHVVAHCDYELHSLDFSTAFLQGSLHEEIWLHRPPSFTGSFPAGTQWSLRWPVYGLRQAPREWHDTLRTTLAALGFAPSTADPSLFLRTDTTLLPLYVLEYVDDLDRAQRTITLTQSHMVQQVLQRFGFTYSSPQSTPLPTGHSLSAPPSDVSVEPSGPHRKVHWDAAKRVLRYLCSTSGMGLVLRGRARVVLTGYVNISWVDDLATQRSSQGFTFSLGSGSVSWQSTCSSSTLNSSCEAEIYAGAMAVQELRWLTYLLTDLGEAPRSPPVLYVENKAMLALCQEHRLEHRTKHIALRYFLAQELQQRGQLRLAYVASQANTADVFTKALQPYCVALHVALRARPSLRGALPPPLLPPTPLLLLTTSLVLRTLGLLLQVRNATAARARVAGVMAVAAGVVVGAAVEVVEVVEVVAAVGVVAGVGALVAAVEAVVGVAVVAAVGVVAVGLEISVEVLEEARGSSNSVGVRPCRPSSFAELVRSGVAIFDLDYDAILAAMYALSVTAEGDCYLCVPHDLGIEAAALGASESVLPGTAPAKAMHTFTLDSGASRCFFCDSTTLTPLSAPVAVRLADPSGGPLLACSSTVLPCPAVPTGSLSGLHLPSFSTNLVSTAALQDAMVTTTTPGGQRVSICTCTRMGRHQATLTRWPGSSLYTLATKPPQVAATAQAVMDVEMAFWKSTGTFVDAVPPSRANIVDGMWIFRVKRPPGSPPAFKARYIARGFTDPSLFLRTDTSLPPFYVLVYVDDLVFATAYTEGLTLVKSELQKRHTCNDLGELRSYLGLQITRDRARRTIILTQSHMVHQVLQRFGFQFSLLQPTPLSTGH
ncbi:unnamed protein product, partial [Closterium sp. NIES-54]